MTNKAEFLDWVSTWSVGAHSPLFCYLATAQGDQWTLIKGVLYLNLVGSPPKVPGDFSVGDIRAGHFYIEGGSSALHTFCGELASGTFWIGNNRVSLTGRADGTVDRIEVDMSSSDPGQSQTRNSVSRLGGALHCRALGDQLSWLLRSAQTPFESVQDLAGAYALRDITAEATIDVVALLPAFIDARSTIDGSRAEMVVKVFKGFNPNLFRAGYRVLTPTNTPERGTFDAREFSWRLEGEDQVGQREFEVPLGAVVQGFATYADKAQQQWWFQDPKHAANHLRAAYEVNDPGLTKLRGWLTHEERKKATDFELGVCTLAWLLGFQPLHLDRSRGLGDGPDVLIAAPQGMVLVECTTGGFGSEKLSKLRGRKRRLRRQLDNIGCQDLLVRAAIATTLIEAETQTEQEEAARQGVVFLGRESFDRLIERTALPPNTAGWFEELTAQYPSDPDIG